MALKKTISRRNTFSVVTLVFSCQMYAMGYTWLSILLAVHHSKPASIGCNDTCRVMALATQIPAGGPASKTYSKRAVMAIAAMVTISSTLTCISTISLIVLTQTISAPSASSLPRQSR